MVKPDSLESARAQIESLQQELRRVVHEDLADREDALREAVARQSDAISVMYAAETRLEELEAASAARMTQLETALETERVRHRREADQHKAEREKLASELRDRDMHIEELGRELGVLRFFSRVRAVIYYKDRVTELGHRLDKLDAQLERLGRELTEIREDLSRPRTGGRVESNRLLSSRVRCETVETHLRVTSERRARVSASLRHHETLLAAARPRKGDPPCTCARSIEESGDGHPPPLPRGRRKPSGA